MKIFSLLLLFSYMAAAKTNVEFVDVCSKQSIRVSTPNGTALRIRLSELDPEDYLEISVTFRPAGIVEDLKPLEMTTVNYYYGKSGDIGSLLRKKISIKKDGTLDILLPVPNEQWMRLVEQKHNEYRIWDAEIRWVQPNSKNAGSGISSFYRSPNNEVFYQLQSEGLCQWEGEADVSSKLYENRSTTFMNVIRESTFQWEQTNNRGFVLGYDNNTGNTIPLGSVAQNNPALGWFFKDWQTQIIGQEYFKYERKYALNRDEVGFFISRMSFNRHEVKRFEWIQGPNQCGEYLETGSGFLDIGQASEGFLVIPKRFFPRQKKLKEFINNFRPALDTCKNNQLKGPEKASDIIPSGSNNGILYYYQIHNLRRHQ
ncbi:MAG: hypothetical protein AB7I27_06020 [Bacteriovoracaceae bacterium]